MLTNGLALPSAAVLAATLQLSSAFLGCSDDPPEPPQPPPPQETTNVELTIDIPDIVENLKPGGKVVIFAHESVLSGDCNLDIEGLEAMVRKEYENGYYYIVIQKLLQLLRALTGLPLESGFGNLVEGALGGGGSSSAGGSDSGGITPSTSPTSTRPVQPEPYPLYRHWKSVPITTQVLSPSIVSIIEQDPYQTPIRFSVSLPFDTFDEFDASGVQGFFVNARDDSGQSVMPAGAQLVNTSSSEWPTSSRLLWDPSHPEVTVLSWDLVNADGSMVTPTQLGCDQHAVTFTFGMSTSDTSANWDFGWAAGLWRTKLDDGTYHGNGGMWLGWHATSYDGVAPANELPEIVAVADGNGNSVTSVSPGDSILLTVQDGLDADQVEISLGGYIVTDIPAWAPGPEPGQMRYSFQVPDSSLPGSWSLFFRNKGATQRTDPSMVGLIVPGYDYEALQIR